MALEGVKTKGGSDAAAEATAAAIGKARGKKKGGGRKDSQGQEQNLNIEGLAEVFPELKKAYAKFLKVKEDFSKAVKDAAEANNANAGTVRTWLKAAVDGKFEERRRHAEQADMLFAAGNPDPDATA